MKSSNAPLAGGGGIPAPAPHNEDSYRALDDLMAVIEELCPVWPQREHFASMNKMLL
jgi:hypothetical protein